VLERAVGRERGRIAPRCSSMATTAQKTVNPCPSTEAISARVYERSRYTSALKSLRYLASFSTFIQSAGFCYPHPISRTEPPIWCNVK
jgi:hypothetical protein